MWLALLLALLGAAATTSAPAPKVIPLPAVFIVGYDLFAPPSGDAPTAELVQVQRYTAAAGAPPPASVFGAWPADYKEAILVTAYPCDRPFEAVAPAVAAAVKAALSESGYRLQDAVVHAHSVGGLMAAYTWASEAPLALFTYETPWSGLPRTVSSYLDELARAQRRHERQQARAAAEAAGAFGDDFDEDGLQQLPPGADSGELDLEGPPRDSGGDPLGRAELDDELALLVQSLTNPMIAVIEVLGVEELAPTGLSPGQRRFLDPLFPSGKAALRRLQGALASIQASNGGHVHLMRWVPNNVAAAPGSAGALPLLPCPETDPVSGLPAPLAARYEPARLARWAALLGPLKKLLGAGINIASKMGLVAPPPSAPVDGVSLKDWRWLAPRFDCNAEGPFNTLVEGFFLHGAVFELAPAPYRLAIRTRVREAAASAVRRQKAAAAAAGSA